MRGVRSPSGEHRGEGELLGGRHAESFDLLPIGTTIGADVAGGGEEMGGADRTKRQVGAGSGWSWTNGWWGNVCMPPMEVGLNNSGGVYPFYNRPVC